MRAHLDDPDSQTEILQILKNAFESLDFYTFIVPGRKTGGFLYARPKQHSKRAAYPVNDRAL